MIPAADLLDTETFAYTVHMSDGVNQLRSETKSVLIDAGDTTIAYASPLLLTEVVPNTDNVGGSDAYEYFEIYNVSEFDIDLSDYHFLYDNGSTVAEWQLELSLIHILGTISLMFREIAGHRPGVITKIGLKTFVDPRLEGGKMNERTKEDLVELIKMDGEERCV